MTVQIDPVQCALCGVYFGIEHNFKLTLMKAGPDRDFYCTNGCVICFTQKSEGEEEKPKQKKDNILTLIKNETEK